jgi:hypothetical protein
VVSTARAVTLVATGVLLLQLRPVPALGNAQVHALSFAPERRQSLAAEGHAGLASLLVHGGGGVVVLIVITILGIWKPRGELRRRPAAS